VKCDQPQQTHKYDVSHYGINLQKIILNSPITLMLLFFAEEFSHKIEAFLLGLKGVFMGVDYGKSNCYGFGLWE
jgi:hypothetical protein